MVFFVLFFPFFTFYRPKNATFSIKNQLSHSVLGMIIF